MTIMLTVTTCDVHMPIALHYLSLFIVTICLAIRYFHAYFMDKKLGMREVDRRTGIVLKVKTEPTEWEKIFANHI